MSTLDDLNAALGEAMADYEADNETSADEVFYDLFVSVVMNFMAENEPTEEREDAVLEFCRTQMGYIPVSLEQFLGRQDWLEF